MQTMPLKQMAIRLPVLDSEQERGGSVVEHRKAIV